MRDQHNKMSKRHGDPSYEDLIARGYLTEAVVNYVALLGWSPRGEIAERRSSPWRSWWRPLTSAASPSPGDFRPEKLNYFNSAYIRALPPSVCGPGRALYPPGGEKHGL